MVMKRRPLKITSAKAWATAPLTASADADADARHHEADLVDHAVAEHAPQVVLDDRVEDREARHDDADVDEQLGAREAPRQRVDRHLGGEGAQEDGPVGVASGYASVSQLWSSGKPGLDAEGEEDQPRRQRPVQPDVAELDGSGVDGPASARRTAAARPRRR